MKKLVTTVLVSAFAALGLYADDGDTFSYMGLNYTVLSEDEKTCEVGSNVDASGDVVIPSTVMNGDNEYRVTAIGTDAFYLNIPMTSISIPESVTEWEGDNTFVYVLTDSLPEQKFERKAIQLSRTSYHKFRSSRNTAGNILGVSLAGGNRDSRRS